MKSILVAIIVIFLGFGIYSVSIKSNNDIDQNDIVAVDQESMMSKDGVIEKQDESMMSNGDVIENKDDGMMDDNTAAMSKGSYESYSPEKLAFAKSGDVVLFFRASWCPTCRALDADIRNNISAIPKGVVILDVDYDNSVSLKQKYGVTYQHTLVQVDELGNPIAKWTSSPTLDALVKNIK